VRGSERNEITCWHVVGREREAEFQSQVVGKHFRDDRIKRWETLTTDERRAQRAVRAGYGKD